MSEQVERIKVSNRDHGALRAQLEHWLREKQGLAGAEVSALKMPESNGMSSETVLFDARWREGGETLSRQCAARLPPDAGAVPVFPVYDLQKQFRAMRLVGGRSGVPVPETLWYEGDTAWLGAPFFVMARAEGEAPPDVMPYPFGSWVMDGSPEQQRQLQERSIATLAAIHAVQAEPSELMFLQSSAPGDTALRRHAAELRAYYEWVAQDGRSPLIERAFDWMEAHWPEQEGQEAISWGDSRIGNMLYRDFEPVAVLDWEMVGIAPRELDLGWMIYLHHFFQDIANQFELPGMPAFMRLNDAVESYARHSGHAPRDMAFYTFYAALRHAAVMYRIGFRSVHFGQAERPADTDDFIMHRASLEAMMDGRYWNPTRAG